MAENIQQAAKAADPIGSSYLVQLIVGLMVVLLCILVLAWVAKRFNGLQSSSDGSLQVLSGMSLGARERLVLVQVGSEQLLLGVAPGNINMLHILDKPIHKDSEIQNRQFGTYLTEKINSALAREK